MFFNFAFILAIIALVLVKQTVSQLEMNVHAGNCSALGHYRYMYTRVARGGTCASLYSANYTIAPNNIPITNVKNECKTRGIITFFNDANCLTPVFVGNHTCLNDPKLNNEVVTMACPSTCKPKYNLSRKACAQKIKECGEAAPMRWTGKGCPGNHYDGGCQCREYCDFFCKFVCTNRSNAKYCYWDKNVCKNKKTGAIYPPRDCRIQE